ncbi:MAG: methionine--tRNA ligase [Acidobacteria bacterium]|nr:methionine--tRNA ligase [Acidobacteriota bacterium]
MTQQLKPFYITTPIYYVNARPHLGHVYTTILADTLARHHRQRGQDTFFLTGTDEHGQKIERAAADKGLPVKDHVDGIVAEFKEMFDRFGLQPDHWIRTTHEYHKQGSQELFRRVQKNGFIYKGEYEGWYCTECGEFKEETTPGEAPWCEQHERPAERVAESSYFFKLSEFQDRLLKFYAEHPDFIQPEARRNEVISFVSSGLKDLSVSRVSVKWGIPVPDDPDHTLYVWFDALSNYITALGFGNDARGGFEEFWPVAIHLVGKDILRFHAVYWPAFLLAADVAPPQRVFAHGMWLSKGRKMSKSLGNAIDLSILLQFFTCEQVRFFCLREMSYGQDGDFTYEALIDRVNGDLAAGWGNLISRTLTMVRNSCGGVLPNIPADASADAVEAIEVLKVKFAENEKAFAAELDRIATGRAMELVLELVGTVDKYLSNYAPWKLAKDESARPLLLTVLNTAVEGLRHITVLMACAMPDAATEVWKQLGLVGSPADYNPQALHWESLPEHTHIGELKGLFPRLNKEKVMAEIQEEVNKQAEAKKAIAPASEPQAPAAPVAEAAPVPTAPVAEAAPAEEKGYITIDDFVKVELRVGQVLEAERIPKADKLLKLQVDLAEEKPRQILAGIAQYYEPEALVGRKIVVVANLAPRKMRGLESQGMLLAASIGSEGRPVLATFTEEVPNGARLK